MLRPLALGLLLVAVATVVVVDCAVLTENGMPILWQQTGGQLTDLPIQNDVLVPNPWHYLHRMSLYRLIIAATDPYMTSMGTNATDSPIWGLTLQLGWELTSGRTTDPPGSLVVVVVLCRFKESEKECIVQGLRVLGVGIECIVQGLRVLAVEIGSIVLLSGEKPHHHHNGYFFVFFYYFNTFL